MTDNWQNRIIGYKQIPVGVYFDIHRNRYDGTMFLTYYMNDELYKSDTMSIRNYDSIKAFLLTQGLEMEYEGVAYTSFIKYDRRADNL